jgi:hypothetical protein
MIFESCEWKSNDKLKLILILMHEMGNFGATGKVVVM